MKKPLVAAVVSVVGVIFVSAGLCIPAQAAGLRKYVKAERKKCEAQLKDTQADCRKHTEWAKSSSDYAQKVAKKYVKQCLKDADVKYDSCMDPGELKAKAVGIKNAKALEKAKDAREAGQDKCNKTKRKKADKCEKIKNSKKYTKCYDKAIDWGYACRAKVEKKFNKATAKLK